MCKIRFIIKNSNGMIIYDDLEEISNDQMNIVDKPFFATYSFGDKEGYLDYNFMDSTEDKLKVAEGNLTLLYGVNSGKFYRVIVTDYSKANDSDFSKIRQLVDLKDKTERFKLAFNQFLKISKILSRRAVEYINARTH